MPSGSCSLHSSLGISVLLDRTTLPTMHLSLCWEMGQMLPRGGYVGSRIVLGKGLMLLFFFKGR